jgi:hypothetical protein
VAAAAVGADAAAAAVAGSAAASKPDSELQLPQWG